MDYRIVKRRGMWVRPDPSVHGSSVEKLYSPDMPDKDCISWATSRSSWDNYLPSEDVSHVLAFDKTRMAWKTYEASAPLDLVALKLNPNSSSWMFMPGKMNSFIEPLETRDLIWSRLPSTEYLLEKARPAEEIVWRARKMWSHDTCYAKCVTCEKEIWLDKLEDLGNGDFKWTCLSKDKTLANCSLTRRAPIENIPWETVHWTINLPCMYSFATEALAMFKAEDLLVSYVDNSPLDIKYVVVQAFSRKYYELSKLAWELDDGYPRAELGEDEHWTPRDFEVPFDPILTM